MRNSKVQKQNIQQLLLRQTHTPRGQGATIPAPVHKLHTNYCSPPITTRPDFLSVKSLTSSRATPGNTESFTPDYTMQKYQEYQRYTENTNNTMKILGKCTPKILKAK